MVQLRPLSILADLVMKLWQQLLVLQQLHDDSITKPKSSAGLGFPSKSLQQTIIPPSPCYGTQLALPVMGFKHNACMPVTGVWQA